MGFAVFICYTDIRSRGIHPATDNTLPDAPNVSNENTGSHPFQTRPSTGLKLPLENDSFYFSLIF